jgi:hypothetical protein
VPKQFRAPFLSHGGFLPMVSHGSRVPWISGVRASNHHDNVQAYQFGSARDVGAAAVARYFKIEDECAQAVRLKLLAQQHDATQPGK